MPLALMCLVCQASAGSYHRVPHIRRLLIRPLDCKKRVFRTRPLEEPENYPFFVGHKHFACCSDDKNVAASNAVTLPSQVEHLRKLNNQIRWILQRRQLTEKFTYEEATPSNL